MKKIRGRKKKEIEKKNKRKFFQDLFIKIIDLYYIKKNVM